MCAAECHQTRATAILGANPASCREGRVSHVFAEHVDSQPSAATHDCSRHGRAIGRSLSLAGTDPLSPPHRPAADRRSSTYRSHRRPTSALSLCIIHPARGARSVPLRTRIEPIKHAERAGVAAVEAAAEAQTATVDHARSLHRRLRIAAAAAPRESRPPPPARATVRAKNAVNGSAAVAAAAAEASRIPVWVT